MKNFSWIKTYLFKNTMRLEVWEGFSRDLTFTLRIFLNGHEEWGKKIAFQAQGTSCANAWGKREHERNWETRQSWREALCEIRYGIRCLATEFLFYSESNEKNLNDFISSMI